MKQLGNILYEALIRPIRIGHSVSDARQFRPIWIVAIASALLTLAGVIGAALVPNKEPILLQQIAHMEHEQGMLSDKLSENEALLDLRSGQIDALRHQLLSLRQEKTEMQHRLDMFDDVLAARKVEGVHMLHPKAEWNGEHGIDYSMILVKGMNYPRWIKGRLVFTVLDDKGDSIRLSDPQGHDAVRIEMTTQLFLEGMLVWPYNWQPSQLRVALIDQRGRKTASTEISLTEEPPAPLETAPPAEEDAP